MADDAPDLEAEQRARRVEIQDDDREVPVLNRIERQVDAGEEERLGVPPRAAIHAQLDLPAHITLAQRVRARLADEKDPAPLINNKSRVPRAVDRALHRRETIEPQRQLEIRRLY